MTYRLYWSGHRQASAMPGKRTGEGGEGTNDRRALNKHLFLRGHHFIDIGDSSARVRANFRGRTHLGSSDRMDASLQSRDQAGQVRRRRAERGLGKRQNGVLSLL